MKINLKTYSIGGLLFGIGILLGLFLFSSDEKSQNEHANHKHHQENVDASEWTCSMHPQIRQDESGDCPICGMDLIPASQMENDIDPDAIKMSKTARKLAQIETITIENQDHESNMNFSGRLEINQDETQSISANFKARIERLYVNEDGEQVQKGQVIAELYAPEIQILKEELELAKRQENEMLLKSITTKIENFQLAVSDVKSIVNGRLKLRSPKTGVISNLKVKEGDNLKADQQLMRIADLSTLWAIVDVYENDLNRIKKGDELNIRIPNQGEITGKISFISPVLDANSRSAKARLVIQNPTRSLKPGVFITAELINSNSELKTSLMIPKSAVLWTGKRSVVYQQLENENGVCFKMKEVETGASSSDFVEILSGLQIGDEIVIHGAFSIDSEAQLANKPSMMNPKTKENTKPNIAWKEVRLEQENFGQIMKSYLVLKEALAEDKEEKSIKIAKELHQKLNVMNFENKEAKKALQELVGDVQKSKNMEDARQHFQHLSDAMIELAEQQNPLNEMLYVQFCPMADNDQGAFWLSTEPEIKNPYFGSMMLKCGNVDREIE
ncbi:efflux RND transporter periplasmic adaptor subunit [Psychroflexus salis]|uniref:Membrane fusion protein, Cu(I)/Ag(I) efflux system n=1 Tax=Psychroflexus salis TaxID=1526574 RepID=A0A916ZTS7_9FLAO|nr:efflux RND transporter periplasmic adaptor subunit [Psychroflexus salis]GGE13705.1 hypothetical protein GCM10010831_13850 [Psychroflexus salis]